MYPQGTVDSYDPQASPDQVRTQLLLESAYRSISLVEYLWLKRVQPASLLTMSSATFKSASEIDTWVEEQFPSGKRQWLNNFKRYLDGSAKERRAKCKPGDGPSLEDCCAVFRECVPPVMSFRDYRTSTNDSKKEKLVTQIAASQATVRTIFLAFCRYYALPGWCCSGYFKA